MIMTISFNPCEMDYSSWLTVSGFIMTILVFLMNEILNKLSVNDEFYYKKLGIIIWVLMIIIIGGIFCFIFDTERFGSILVTIVLFALPIFPPFLLFYKRNAENNLQKGNIDQLLPEYQPNINLD